MKIILITIATLACSACGGSSSVNPVTEADSDPGPSIVVPSTPEAPRVNGLLTHRLKSETGANLDYLEYVPANLVDPAPLIVFHHGSGATGGDLADVECCGLPVPLVAENYDTGLPFIMLAPQRSSALDTLALDTFLDYALLEYNVDAERVYFIGWSQGANVSARYAHTFPGRLKAMVFLAGGFFQGVPDEICDAGPVSVWGFAGVNDSSFITQTTEVTSQAFAECGSDMRYTLFTEADHWEASVWPFQINSPNTFEGDSPYEISVFDWLLDQ